MQKRPAAAERRRPSSDAQPQTCPNCHALVQDGDIICVACGTNLLTGQKVAEEKPKPEFATPWRIPWVALGVLAVLVLVIAGVVLVSHVMTRDPLKQAMSLAADGNYLEATELLTNYIGNRPDNAQAHYELGRLYWKQKRFSDAASSFDRASKLEPTNLEAAMLAVASLASVPGGQTTDRQAAVLKRVVDAFPDNTQACLLLALARGNQKDTPGQIEALARVLEQGPANTAAVRQSLGIALARQGEYEKAQREFQSAPERPDILAADGFVADMAGDPDRAVEKLRAAVEEGTSIENEALVRLGLILVSQGRFAEADEYLREAASGNQSTALARFFHGVCLQARGLLPEALSEFEAVSEQQDPLAFEALLRMADIHLAQGNAQPARGAISQADQSGRSSPALYTLKGRMHAATGTDGPAREAFTKALQMDPSYAPAHLESGLLYVKQQVLGEGIRALERYLELVGSNVEGTRATEIRALVDQLELTETRGGLPRGAVAAAETGEML